MNTTKIKDKFQELYGPGGTLYVSPGRINLIGEHTDYNGGFVLPGAIDKAMYCVIKPNGTDKVKAYALDLNESSEFGLKEEDKPKEGFAKYIFGVVREMAKRGKEVPGFDIVISGDVPLGAGMSSSAALESAVGYALNDQFGLGFTRPELATIGQSTEHNYVGVKCGIMDQFASCMGKEGSLIRLDCRSLEHEYVPFNPKGYQLVLLNTCVTHELASSAYNKRRESCERVVEAIKKRHPVAETGHALSLLRDANLEMLEEVKNEVSAEDYMRADFVIGEIQRLLDTCEALKKGDYETVGQKMYETHEGLSKKYEVSCPELDFLNDQAKKHGVTGSRVMGGGFGGCTINLVKDEKVADFVKGASEAYEKEFGIKPKVYDVVIKDGARKIE
ncbi:galactokinase [Bacteroidia bacterium]|nr:galactokinase [Bacteroidia bacterium]GHT47631.1 galactokinase [Bacteroidia bacterium]